MRIRDWYFQGWERRTGPEGKTEFVYTGEVYTLPGGLRHPKRFAALCTAGIVVLYGAAALLPSQGGMWRFSAFPQLLELIPVMYLIMGAVSLARAAQPMTYRDWYASWRRLQTAALGSLIFTGAMALLEIVYLILFTPRFLPETPYLLCSLGSAALSALLWDRLRRSPCAASTKEE